MARVYVSGGSNIEAQTHIPQAIATLKSRYGRVHISSIYSTPAVGFEGDDFLNFVAGFETDESPAEVAAAMYRIEDEQGRVRGTDKFAPRTLDLDVLLYDDLVIQRGRLQIPRDEILRYAFVLGPLAEIAGDLQHPETGETFQHHWQVFNDAGQPLQAVSLALD